MNESRINGYQKVECVIWMHDSSHSFCASKDWDKNPQNGSKQQTSPSARAHREKVSRTIKLFKHSSDPVILRLVYYNRNTLWTGYQSMVEQTNTPFTHTFTPRGDLESPINLKMHVFDSGRKSQYTWGETCKLHAENPRRIQTSCIFLLWGNRATFKAIRMGIVLSLC